MNSSLNNIKLLFILLILQNYTELTFIYFIHFILTKPLFGSPTFNAVHVFSSKINLFIKNQFVVRANFIYMLE